MTGEWVKACGANTCVEVRYVTACNNHACVEVGTERINDVPVILVRDSMGSICRYSPQEWDEFLDGVRRNVFNREALELLI